MKEVPGPTIKRLVQYYRYLDELERKDGEQVISSVMLGKGVGVSATQIRKDLSYLGHLGCKGIGYDVMTLKCKLKEKIGFNRNWPTVLIGAGNLGRALVHYDKFKKLGLNIIEIFDCDLSKIGNMVNGLCVRSSKELVGVITENEIKIAVIAVPAAEAPLVANTLIKAGIKAIWNFAPVPLKLSEDIIVMSEDLSSGIGSLFFRLNNEDTTLLSEMEQ